MKKRFFSAAFMLLATVGAFAQGNGIGGITEATNMVTSYFDPGTKLIYAIGAVVGLIGGVKVYSKFSSGDPDTSKTAASWFGACIFLIVAATILRSRASTCSSSRAGCSPCSWCSSSCTWWVSTSGSASVSVSFPLRCLSGQHSE